MTLEKESEDRSLEFYLGLSYPIEIQNAEEGGFVVGIPALPGCIVQVESWDEVQNNIEEVRIQWIKAAYEDGANIPLPEPEKKYSGKFVVRVPKSIHRKLDGRADREGVSLNTLIVSMVSEQLNVPIFQPPQRYRQDYYPIPVGMNFTQNETQQNVKRISNIGGIDERVSTSFGKDLN